MITWNDPLPVLWLVPTLLMAIVWIRTPIFITARGKRILMWLKIAILSLLVLALLNPRWETSRVQENRRAVFAIDASPSIDRAEIAKALAKVTEIAGEFPQNVQIRILTFAHHTRPEAEAAMAARQGVPAPVADAILKAPRKPDTDLGAALSAAQREILPGQRARIYLFSDGQDLGGNLAHAVDSLSEANVPVTTIPMEPRRPDPAPHIIRVVNPEHCFIGDEVGLQILLHHPQGGPIRLSVKGSDGSSQKRAFEIAAGMSVATFSFRPEKVGTVIYSCEATNAHHQLGGTAIRRSATQVRPVPKVLVFEGNEQEGLFFRSALAREGIDYTHVNPGSWPRDLAREVEQYPCLVMNNIPAKAFTKKDLAAIRDQVREGAGLMMVGGPNSFGLGDYTDTPIEEAMPVKMPKRTINQGMALILVLDASGSMSGDPWNYLVLATKEIVRLCQGHFLGIILFNTRPTWILPLQQVGDPEPICNTLDYYYPSGGTVFSLPMAEALWALKNQPFPRKNVIMLSDGVPSDFNFVSPLYENFRDQNVSITTIAAGRNVNITNLEEIAYQTNGHFYESPEFSELPGLFRKEFKRLSGPAFVEKPFQPVLVENEAMTKGIAQAEIPELNGLVITIPKPMARVLLASPRGDPVLAVWRFGLGRGAAFTTDLLPAWSTKWARWDGFGKLLRQAIKDLSSGKGEPFAISTAQRGTDLEINLEAGAQIKIPPTMLELRDERGKSRSLRLTELPDRQAIGRARDLPPGIYHCRILGPRDVLLGETMVAANDSAEGIPQPVNFAQLRLIAEQTGGETLSSMDDQVQAVFPPGAESRLATYFWPYIVLAALFLYLIDIYLRRANVFGITTRAEARDMEEQRDQIFLQLAQRFSNLAEEHSLRGEEEEAKQFYLRAKAFYLKAEATQEANRMWERYKRFEQ